MSTMPVPTLEQRAAHAADVLDAWAHAIRGDWGTIDGRCSKGELTAITRFLRGETNTLTYDEAGVCRCEWGPSGHWHDPYAGWRPACPESPGSGSEVTL